MSITTSSARITAKQWLKANGYADLLKLVSRLEAKWKAAGNGTRRDWFLLFAGTEDGKPRTMKDGTTFPIVAAFQRRAGYPVTAEALQRGPLEVAPPIRKQVGRWGKRFRRAKR